MSRKERKIPSQEFKLSAVERMAAGENVVALAIELGVLRKSLFAWRDQLRIGGAEALQPRRPGPKPGSRRRRKLASFGVDGLGAVSTTAPLEYPAGGTGSVTVANDTALAAALARISELEQKVGRQALELDFFQRALRHFRAERQPGDTPGATATTPSSER
jgi:transposase